jgi:hypothetical protein
MKVRKYFEFLSKDFDAIKSFYIKDELPKNVWDDFKLKKEIKEQLIVIGQDFFDKTEIKADVKDIVLCGSLCNYNWSEKYSDFDLHIIIDFNEVNKDYEIVEKLCDYAKKMWNAQHDIKIKGYDVEIAIQDENDLYEAMKTSRMGGVYSLFNNRWLKKPEKVEFEPDEKMIKEKAKSLMMKIDDIEETKDEDEYHSLKQKIDSVWKKIKDFRKSGLESQSGEFSIGNLVFKLLRRNGYISKVMEMKKESYDKQFK